MVLLLSPGTFTHSTAGVPIIVACTKADIINDTMALGASGMGGMVKGKGGGGGTHRRYHALDFF
jgi:dynein light intermediate chain 1